jgi:PAS domain-containing protein
MDVFLSETPMSLIDKILMVFGVRRESARDVQRQRKIRFLLDKSPLPSWIRDKGMVLQYCNFAYADIFETTPEGVLQKQIPFYGDGDASALARAALERDTPQSTTATVIVGGKRRLYEITEIPTLDGEAVVGYASDYSAVEDLQSALERHIQSSQDIYEFLGSAVAIFGAGRTLQFYNHAFVQMWKLEEEWLSQGPTVGEFLDQLRRCRMMPESLDFQNMRKEYMGMFTSLLEPKQAFWHLPDERTIKITIIPHPLGGIFFSYENVTDRLALERNYKTLLSVHESVIHDLEEGLLIWGSDGRIQRMNTSCYELLCLDQSKDSYEGMRLQDLLDSLKPLLLRLSGYRWPAFQKRLLARFMGQKPRHGMFRLNNGVRLRYVLRSLPDGAFVLSLLPMIPSSIGTGTHFAEDAIKNNGVAESQIHDSMAIAPVLTMMDAVVPAFRNQFQHKGVSISLNHSGGFDVTLPQKLFEDAIKMVLSLIVLCVKPKSEVGMTLKLLRGYVILDVAFVLSKDAFHVLPRDLKDLPGITSLARQYSQYLKLDVELAQGDAIKLSLAFFPHHSAS